MFKQIGIQTLRIIKNPFENALTRRNYPNLWKPPYLELIKPTVPVYMNLNFKIKGYDFALLESYQGYVHSLVDDMGLVINETWAAPAKKINVSRLEKNTKSVFKFTEYERIVQIAEIPAYEFSIFLRLAKAAIPQGLYIEIAEHTPEDSKYRFIPDTHLAELQSQLENVAIKRVGKFKPKKK